MPGGRPERSPRAVLPGHGRMSALIPRCQRVASLQRRPSRRVRARSTRAGRSEVRLLLAEGDQIAVEEIGGPAEPVLPADAEPAHHYHGVADRRLALSVGQLDDGSASCPGDHRPASKLVSCRCADDGGSWLSGAPGRYMVPAFSFRPRRPPTSSRVSTAASRRLCAPTKSNPVWRNCRSRSTPSGTDRARGRAETVTTAV